MEFIRIILTFVNENFTKISIGAIITLGLGLWRLFIAKKSLGVQKKEFENKNNNFSIYLENSYRLHNNLEKSKKILIFNVRINNHSFTKNSFNGNLIVEYLDEYDNIRKVSIDHNSNLEIPMKDLTIFKNEVRVEEKDIKSGLFLFLLPTHLKELIINKYIVKVSDVNGNFSTIESYLIKDIIT